MASDFAHRLSQEQELAQRMERHRLVERAAPSDLIRVVGEICGLHAQLMSSAELRSLWARIHGLERDALHETLWKRRALVKLWAVRGSPHLLPSAVLGVWLCALGTYTNRGNTGQVETDVLAEAVGRALEGRILTREELALAVEISRNGGESGPRGERECWRRSATRRSQSTSRVSAPGYWGETCATWHLPSCLTRHGCSRRSTRG